MTPVHSFASKRVAVFGLGGSGLVSAQALKAGGADVVAWDDNAASVKKAQEAGITAQDLRNIDWSKVAALVLAPGVPLTHPEPHWSVKLAQAAGAEVVGDIELFCRERLRLAPHSPFVAITGTNGKSTTTALIAHILRTAGKNVQLGGNIGTAILSLEPPAANRFHVIECSSYQIDLAPSLNPSVGILINLSPDHLDRHGTMEHYAAVKERLVAKSDVALVGVDDSYTEAIARRLAGRKDIQAVPVSASRELPRGTFVRGTQVVARGIKSSAQAEVLGDVSGIGSLRGRHNAQNAAFASTACWFSGLTSAEIERGLKSFPGLAHRMEQVGRKGAVLFVNDSKATNADSSAQALASFTDMFWIAGGKAKAGGITSLEEFFPRIRKAYLVGEAAKEFAQTLDGKVPYEISGTIDRALETSTRDAEASGLKEPVVLLSPACASFDQFRNFEVRGDHFRELVLKIPGVTPFK
ncbi:UDP-N-acetylmuramoyl-L-alanine--D-glutamate ligase [Rhodoplanes sp. Z2-YC6860]|uniref:UDP-N-acetylmuramoyl-L-alanine--D-glutamate ligase n=1 Tax=Rhodoplanes sp. Z2-YC6860 TaxID=674703 RepID=UPI00078EBD25|nr:UDP-N-acetylmuramoyl-L-alanine--D-glutamate ligase [Rhodoplanes sp. Z2-YC6860]AMN44257.1 UDP-N-acetylmuramoyl-L-alanyl-D-glutamate synthetase [Rhodoplanes sp. Z2-YC6860]